MKDIGKQVTIFQSTPPIQGATGCTSDQPPDHCHFNPRPLYRERPVCAECGEEDEGISIHAPYTGSDMVDKGNVFRCRISIHAPYTGSDREVMIRIASPTISIHAPYTGSDGCWQTIKECFHISIHAPYTGSDRVKSNQRLKSKYFNPRPLYRERQRVGPYTGTN